MKILYICLANFYLEGMGYQENILSYYHKKSGYDVEIITSQHVFKKELCGKENYYVNDFGAKVYAVKNKYDSFLKSLRIYDGLYEAIVRAKPDIIFVHGGQFVSLRDVIKYCKNNKNVKLYIDQHADYYNSPVKSLKSKIAAKYIIGHYMRKSVPFTERFYGVTPWRCQFLNEIYGIPKGKIELLIMGGHDEKIDFVNLESIRNSVREKLNITNEDFLIITGGKIDKAKNIHLLAKAVKEIKNKKIKLVVFGKILDDMKEEMAELLDDENIRYIEWLLADKVYDYFLSSDLAVFPGTHSVLWEQACACGIPGIFKNWSGMQHVDMGGNCEFLYQDSFEEVKQKILEVYKNKEKYQQMKQAAYKARKKFFYSEISKLAIKK